MTIKLPLLRTALLAALLFVFTSGCTTTPSSNAEMHKGWDPWIGQKIENLTAKWGAPGRLSEIDEDKSVYSWFYLNGSRVSFARYFAAVMFARHDSFLESRDHYCRMDWTVDKEGHITGWQDEGQCLVIYVNKPR